MLAAVIGRPCCYGRGWYSVLIAMIISPVILQVKETSLKVNSLLKEVFSFQEQFPWLQLISMPKVWIMNKLLETENISAFRLLCEVFHITDPSLDVTTMDIVVGVRGLLVLCCILYL